MVGISRKLRKQCEEMGWKVCGKGNGDDLRRMISGLLEESELTLTGRLDKIRRLIVEAPPYSCEKVLNKEGVYIAGSYGQRLIKGLINRGIQPEPFRSYKVCSIGFSEKQQKWYGWSHRAFYGFGVGDCVDSKDHFCAVSGWTQEALKKHPELDVSLPVGFTAKSLEDCKKMAIAFADSVG